MANRCPWEKNPPELSFHKNQHLARVLAHICTHHTQQSYWFNLCGNILLIIELISDCLYGLVTVKSLSVFLSDIA